MKNHSASGYLLRGLALLLVLGFWASAAYSFDSVYLISDHNNETFDVYNLDSLGIIAPYLSTNLTCQNDPSGLAIWAVKDTMTNVVTEAYLFVTGEFSNYIEVFDVLNFVSLGCVSNNAAELAGIGMDRVHNVLYAITRQGNALWAYDWNPTTHVLTTKPGFPITLSSVTWGMGLAVDSRRGVIYIADISNYGSSGTIRGFDLNNDFAEVFDWVPSSVPMDVAIDERRNILYTTHPDGYCASGQPGGADYVCMYNVTGGLEVPLVGARPTGTMGVTVVGNTGYIYLTHGCDGDSLSVWKTDVTPWQMVQVIHSIGNPAGIVTAFDVGTQGDPGLGLGARTENACVMPHDTVTISIPYWYSGTFGTLPVNNVVVEVSLPSELDIVSVTDSPLITGHSLVQWNVGTMIVGNSGFQQIVATVNNTAVRGTFLHVAAQIRSDLPSNRWDNKSIDVEVCPSDTSGCVVALCRDVTVIADSTCMAPASIDSGSYDCNGGPVTLTQHPPGPYPLGTTSVTLVAENGTGDVDSCTATVTVRELNPPQISVEFNKYVLWPPNHKMVDITATVRVTDDCCPRPTFKLVSIWSNEPDNGLGDGNTIGDIKEATFGRPDVAFQLRAERSGTGTGRIYSIIYAAEDCSGNVAYDTVQVSVPHNGGFEDNEPLIPETPSVTTLLPGYPNPFNPTIAIPFSLAAKELVSLQVFDTQGRLVRTLCNDIMPEGTHEAIWDGRDNAGGQAAAGMYFARFRAGTYEMTRKLVMVR
jgi:hypothetical protein